MLSARAKVRKAQLDLGFTKITSPIDGIAGEAKAQLGDLVGTPQGTPFSLGFPLGSVYLRCPRGGLDLEPVIDNSCLCHALGEVVDAL